MAYAIQAEVPLYLQPAGHRGLNYLKYQMSKYKERVCIFGIEAVFVCCIFYGCINLSFKTMDKYAAVVARYTACLIMKKVIHGMMMVMFKYTQKKEVPNWWKVLERNKLNVLLMVTSFAVLSYLNERLVTEDSLLLLIAFLIASYPDLEQKLTINYGVGMACSYYEGYLGFILPNDGAKFGGFLGNITVYEAGHGVVFPVKKLFIIITKSLYCPPDLKEFNLDHNALPYLEACQSFESLTKDVAGVKNRVYRNPAYKIYRKGAPPVYLAVECASPVNTLHRVLQKRAIYEDLSKTDPTEIVNDFCTTLQRILDRAPEARGKCELIFFDDTDPTQNLAQLLLNEIERHEPNFEEIIQKAYDLK